MSSAVAEREGSFRRAEREGSFRSMSTSTASESVEAARSAPHKWLRGRLQKDGDTPEAVSRKVAWFTLLAMSCLFGVAAAAGTYSWEGGGMWMSMAAFAVLVAGCAACLLATRTLTPFLLNLSTCVMALMVTACDLYAMPTLWRIWPLFIMILDALLVVEAPRHVSYALVLYIALWLVVAEAEYLYRFGLLDLDIGMVPYATRGYRFDCDRPPCRGEGLLSGLSGLVPQLGTFLMDYFITRRFAERVMSEKRMMKATIHTSQHIAHRLSRFDLDAAEAFLEAQGPQLSTPLLHSFEKLLSNLRLYRPYLPQAFFQETLDADLAAGIPGEPAIAVPGYSATDDNGWVALCFTDIRSSTALWENNPHDLMREVLLAHNALMRDCAAAAGGYEVKTIGDAFMLAFPDTAAAVGFGIAAQAKLAAEGVFPSALTRPGMEEDGLPALSVRIGVHAGPAAVELNPLTLRYDYFGNVVNKAARIEAHGVPTAVTVSDAVLRDLEAEGAAAGLPDGITFMPFKEKRIGKGLAEPMALTALFPVEALQTRVKRLSKAHGLASAGGVEVIDVEDDVSTVPRTGTDPLVLSAQSTPAVTVLEPKRTGRGTVGVVKLVAWEAPALQSPRLPALTARPLGTPVELSCVDALLRETKGTIATVISDLVVASWGVSTYHRQHVSSAVRFAARLYDRMHERDVFHAGLCTGEVRTQQVMASASQGFVTLHGPAVEGGMLLCTEAVQLQAQVLVASQVGLAAAAAGDCELFHTNAFVTPHLRPVGHWDAARAGQSPSSMLQLMSARSGELLGLIPDTEDTESLPDGGAVPLQRTTSMPCASSSRSWYEEDGVTLYQVCLATLSQAITEAVPAALERTVTSDEGAGAGDAAWGLPYVRAFAAKDCQALRRLAKDDPTVSLVADRLGHAAHLTGVQLCRRGGL